MLKTLLLAAIPIGFLVAAIGLGLWMWFELGAVEIESDGLVALAGGSAAALTLGVGLMRLVYWSHRKGYDEPERDGDA